MTIKKSTKSVGAAGQEAARRLFPVSFRAWQLLVGLAALSAMSGKAQAQQSDQSLTWTQPSDPGQAPAESKSKTTGNYAVQQSLEFGYRDSLINGNIATYDTFENLGSGLRLFNYTVEMHSVNHQGPFFDNLTFSNFGYGGDPNDVSRLHVDKDKWYDFRAMFRRDKNFWNYSLLANPLNPVTGPIPNGAVRNSPHSLDLSRRMQDYDLTLFPQSRLRFRLGYSHNANTGPAATTIEGGTEPILSETVNDITNAYRMGVDYRGLPKTTVSFDELLTYSTINYSATDNNFPFQLSNGMPVDIGIVSVGTTPCAAASITPPTVSAVCSGYLSYSQVQNPRSSFPTERVSFQSTYVKNLAMSGSFSYSGGYNSTPGFNEAVNGWASRTVTRGSTTSGPARANRVMVSANWSGDYHLTDKLSVVDEFSFENWRIPSMWATADTNIFDLPTPTGQSGMLLLPFFPTPANMAIFGTAAECPSPYTAATCPQHNASSGADVTNELVSQFLGQNTRSNTVELKSDLARRVSAYAGYEFTARTIEDFSAIWDAGEIYLPGGAGGTPGLLQPGGTVTGNYFRAARGDCAVVATVGPSQGTLPAACTFNATTGWIAEGSATNLVPEAANDTARNVYEIHENAGVAGVIARPIDALRINGDVLFGYNDQSFTRISPRQVQSYKVHARYTPRQWANLDAAVNINQNRDNVFTVNNIEHARTYSFAATLSPKPTLWADFGYSYMDIYTQTEICFVDTGSTVFTTANSPCPIAAAVTSGLPLGTLSYYASRDSYAYGNVMWKPAKRVTATVGYGGSIVRGKTTFLNALTPSGTLNFNYLKPSASLAFDIYKGVTYKTSWNYFGYNGRGFANPAGLAPLPSQNFDGSNVTFSFLYAF